MITFGKWSKMMRSSYNSINHSINHMPRHTHVSVTMFTLIFHHMIVYYNGFPTHSLSLPIERFWWICWWMDNHSETTLTFLLYVFFGVHSCRAALAIFWIVCLYVWHHRIFFHYIRNIFYLKKESFVNENPLLITHSPIICGERESLVVVACDTISDSIKALAVISQNKIIIIKSRKFDKN